MRASRPVAKRATFDVPVVWYRFAYAGRRDEVPISAGLARRHSAEAMADLVRGHAGVLWDLPPGKWAQVVVERGDEVAP